MTGWTDRLTHRHAALYIRIKSLHDKLLADRQRVNSYKDTVSPVYHLAAPDHEEAAVPDVGGVQLEIGVAEHHEARRARPDYLGLALLHLAETLSRK